MSQTDKLISSFYCVLLVCLGLHLKHIKEENNDDSQELLQRRQI